MSHMQDPRFVLIDVFCDEDPENNYWVVEMFDPDRHLSLNTSFGGAKSGQTFFDDPRDVAHLRDRILN